MTRYQALRALGCDRLTAGAIAMLNWLRNYPPGEIRFMHLVVEYDHPTNTGVTGPGAK